MLCVHGYVILQVNIFDANLIHIGCDAVVNFQCVTGKTRSIRVLKPDNLLLLQVTALIKDNLIKQSST